MKRYLHLYIVSIAFFFSQLLISQTNLWGVTSKGGTNDDGVLFVYQPISNTYTLKATFSNTSTGENPEGSLVKAIDGNIYGMANKGGANNKGTIYKYNIIAGTLSIVHHFNGTNGETPFGGLVQASNGKLYGMTSAGGSNGHGVIFEFDPITSSYAIKFNFNETPTGASPYGNLIEARNGKLYGLCRKGGVDGDGTLFEYAPISNVFSKKVDFKSTARGAIPYGSLFEASNGLLYGLTSSGGSQGEGVIFSYEISTSSFSKLFNFSTGSYKGNKPLGSLIQIGTKLYGLTSESSGTGGLGTLFDFDINTNIYNELKQFVFLGFSGATPMGTLTNVGGELFGLTQKGTGAGITNFGTIFKYDPISTNYNVLKSFSGTFGSVIGAEPTYTSLLKVSTCSNTFATVAISRCDSLVSPSGTYTWYTPGTYTDIIPNAAGCDSIITINYSYGTFPSSQIGISVTNASCPASTNGKLQVNIFGPAVGPYSYLWSNAATTSTITGLSPGTYYVTVNNGQNCKAVDSATVIELDTIPPTAVVANPTIYINGSGIALLPFTSIENGSFDNCSLAGYTISKTSFNCSNLGTNNVNLIVTDDSGNKDTATSVVTILDTLKPNLIPKINYKLYLNASGNASLTAAVLDSNSSDNCSIASRSISKTSFNCTNLGNNNIWFKVTDNSGNTDSILTTIQVIDNIKPTANTQNVNVYLDSLGTASILASAFDNGSTDNCGITSFTASQTTFDSTDIGSNPITITIQDASANVRTVVRTAFVFDTIPPTLILTSPSVFLDANGDATLNVSDAYSTVYDAGVIDTIYLSKYNYNCSNIGTNPFTVTAVDKSGNTTSLSSTFTLADTTKPKARVKNLYQAYLNASGIVNVSANDVDSLSNDNCGIDTMYLDQTLFKCVDVGMNIVNFMVRDSSNNIDTAKVVVEVLDTFPPTPVVQNINLYLDNINGKVTFDGYDFDNGTFDNCGIDTIQAIPNNFSCSEIGANTVTIRVRDVNGNTTLTTAIANVLDTIPPQIINCPANIVEYATSTNCTAIATWPLISALDTCGIDSLVSNFTSGSVFPIGTTTVQYIAYDPSLNTDTCSFTVTVIDTIAPIISNVPANIVQNNDPGQCSAIINWSAITATDNCALDSLVGNYSSGDTFPIGVSTVQYIAYDASMNTDTIQFTVTVNDTEAPTVVCQSDTTVCSSIVNYRIPRAFDNCSGITLTRVSGLASGSTFPIGVTTITYEAVDASNNKDSCSFDITVLPSPTLPRAGNDTIICDFRIRLNANVATVGTGSWSSPNASINFQNPSDPNTVANTLSLGSNTLVWTITNGNCAPISDTIIVSVEGQPIANAGNDISLCNGNSINLNATAPNVGNGAWTVISGTAIFADANLFNTNASGFTTGRNVLVWTVNTANCGSDSDTLIVKYGLPLTADAGADRTIFLGSSSQLNVVSNDSIATYLWTPATGLNDATIKNPIASPTLSTEYIVNITSLGGCTASDTVWVRVSELLTIPTAFTPNNDGFNDTWRFENLSTANKIEVVVYNSFGNEVFKSLDYVNPWDGKYNGELLPVGSYYWVVNIYQPNGEKEMMNGIVSILR